MPIILTYQNLSLNYIVLLATAFMYISNNVLELLIFETDRIIIAIVVDVKCQLVF